MDLLLFAAVCLGSVVAQPDNIWCERNVSCTVDCANQTINDVYTPGMHCDYGGIIKGYEALNLHILCNNGSFGCKQLQIECPKQDDWEPTYNFCHLDCTGDSACLAVQIHNPESDFIHINCMNGNRTCNRMRITTDAEEPNKNNKIFISCNTTTAQKDPICESMDIAILPRQVTSTVLYFDCYEQGICHNISIVSVNTSVKLSVFDAGEFVSSTVNVEYLSMHLAGGVTVQHNQFILNAWRSTFVIELYRRSYLIYNDFYVVEVHNVSILSDHTSTFAGNNIYGASDAMQVLHVQGVVITSCNINIIECSIVRLHDSIFESSSLNMTYGDVLDIRNTRIISNSMIRAPYTYTTNVLNSSISESLVIVSHNKDVHFINASLYDYSRITATHVSHTLAVYVGMNAVLTERSIIDAQHANNFSLTCHGLCDDSVSIYTPNAPHKAYITCIEYGCKSLDLYTFNNADDITFIPLHCPCDEDAHTACIESWNIRCAYDTRTDAYLNESHFNSATQCIGDDGVCCGDIIHRMHQSWCAWPANQFECVKGSHCVIDCNRVNNTNNIYNNFSCNTKQSIINATQALSLTVFCHKGDTACTNLTVFCPNQKPCHVYCDGNQGCNLLTIDAQTSNQLVLECIADKACTDIMIMNGNKAMDYDVVRLRCEKHACNTVQMYQMGQANVHVECISQSSCNELWLDCTDCHDFTFICAPHAWCTNSIFKATNATSLQLKCSSTGNGPRNQGCYNITAYVPPKNATITCDAYGCNALTLYSLSTRSVTDAVAFHVANCPCVDEVHSLCVGNWSLYCNDDADTPSIFSDGMCDGDCCGSILDQFHESICSPFDCAISPGTQCAINCSDLVTHGYLCRNKVIRPSAQTVSLDVYCTEDVDCYGLMVYCNPFGITQQCNIYCEGDMICRNITIYTNGTGTFTFTCSNGVCQDILIVDTETTSLSGHLAIDCDNSYCTNLNAHQFNSATVDLICDTACVYDGIYMSESSITQLNALGRNVMILNSIFNVTDKGRVDINVLHIENTTLYGSEWMAITTYGVFKNNVINSSQCHHQTLHLLDTHASSNVIISPNVISLLVNVTCLTSASSQPCVFSDYFLLTHALLVRFSMRGSISVAATISAPYASQIHLNIAHDTHGSLIVDGYNATNLSVVNYGAISDTKINATLTKHIGICNHQSISNMTVHAENASDITMKCMNESVCDVHIKADYALYMYCAISGGVEQHLMPIIDATYAQNIFILIDAQTNITDDHYFVLNANHASHVQMTIDGVLSTHKHINATNVEKYMLNGRGSLTQSVIDCDWCHELHIQLFNLYNNRIDMNHGQVLRISNSHNVSRNTFHILSVQNVDVYNAQSAAFTKNVLYANHTQTLEILNYGAFQSNTVYGFNITKVFNLSCFGNYSVCGDYDVLWLNHTKDINIKIGEYAQNKNSLTVHGEHAQSIMIGISGWLSDSWVSGEYAKYLTIECNASDRVYGCDNVSIIASPSVNNTKQSSSLTCIKYGCRDLTLYTRHDATDINISARECPCKDDVVDLCIDKWQIHCNNETHGVSFFTGLNQCNGSCCGNIQKTLENKECVVHRKKKNNDWIIYTVIGITFCLYLIVAAIWIIRKKRQQHKQSADYMRTY